MKAKKVYDVFEKLNINYENVEHLAIYTAEDAKEYDIKMPEGVCDCKNLFLRNKNKTKYYLVSLPVDKKADLKQLQEKLGETKLSFGSEELLQEKLDIKSGSVSVLNIIGIEKTDVEFIIDSCVLETEKVGFHPNDNTKTIIFPSNSIGKILDYYSAKYEFINI